MNGIVFENGSSGSLSYCTIKNANTGVLRYAGSSLSSITYCTITNCNTGVNCTGLPVFDNNTVSNNQVGASISSTGVTSEILSNTITQNSGTGLVLNNVLSRNGVSWNTITYNGGYGVSCSNGATPYMWQNTISNNSSDGLHCEGNSPAHFGSQYGDPGLNAVRNNGRYGVYANSSNVYMGSTDTHYGENSITNAASYELSAVNNSVVYAQYNWWGVDPITSANVHTESGGVIYAYPWLHSDPIGNRLAASLTGYSGASTTQTEEVSDQPISIDTSFFDYELNAAIDKMSKGQFQDAITLYTKKFQNEKNIQKKEYAVEQLAACYREIDSTTSGGTAKEKEFIDFLNKSVRPGISKSSELYGKTLELESIFLTDLGRYEKAAAVLQSIKDNFADSNIQKNADFNLAYLYCISLSNPSKGKEYIDELASKYPDDQMTSDAKIIFGTNTGSSLSKEENGKSNLAEKETEKPLSYSLMPNYPNPFNPSTTISYNLPRNSSIEIEIFDILGNKIRSFTIPVQSAGRHGIVWNGTNNSNEQVSSGIYLYHFKAVSVEGKNETFEKTAKLLLMK